MAYIPSRQVLDHLSQVRLVLLVGVTGVGKNTLINQLISKYHEYHFVLTEMSRPPRPEEESGRDAVFADKAAMEAKIAAGAYVQVAPSLFGDYYATSPDQYVSDKICILPCVADEVPNMKRLPFKELKVIVILPPSFDEWMRRMGSHHFVEEKIARRLGEANHSLLFAAESRNAEYVTADTVEGAADMVHSIAHGGSGEDPSESKALAMKLLAELDRQYPA